MSTIIKNISLLSIGNIIALLVDIGFFYKMISYFSIEVFGFLSYGLSYMAIVALFLDFGFNGALIQEISKNTNSTLNYVNKTIFIKIILFSLYFIPFVIVLTNSPFTDIEQFTLLFFHIGSLSRLIFNTYLAGFQANEQMKIISISRVLISVGYIFGLIILEFFHLGIIHFSLMISSINILVMVYIYLNSANLPKQTENLIFFTKDRIYRALSFFILNMHMYLFMNQFIEQTLILIFLSNLSLGVYNLAFKIIIPLIIIPSILSISIFPQLSRLSEISLDELNKLFNKILRVSVVIVIPIVVSTNELLTILPMLVNINFYDSVELFFPFTLLIAIYFIKIPLNKYLEAVNKERLEAVVSIISILFSVILFIIILPNLGLKTFVLVQIGIQSVYVVGILIYLNIYFDFHYIRDLTLLVSKLLIPLAIIYISYTKLGPIFAESFIFFTIGHIILTALFYSIMLYFFKVEELNLVIKTIIKAFKSV